MIPGIISHLWGYFYLLTMYVFALYSFMASEGEWNKKLTLKMLIQILICYFSLSEIFYKIITFSIFNYIFFAIILVLRSFFTKSLLTVINKMIEKARNRREIQNREIENIRAVRDAEIGQFDLPLLPHARQIFAFMITS